ncbi:MAG: hypothetical protein AMXMBFR13_34010 [Phycisphaerae bacterium]
MSSPATSVADSAPAPAETAVPPTQPIQGRILIVDDAQFFCEGLRRVLRIAGYQCAVANDGQQALMMVGEMPFDVIITDLRMPYMSGDDLVVALKKAAPTLPCIVVTGNATRDRILKMATSGNLAAVLTKPVDHERLLTTLSSVLAGKGRPAQPPAARKTG